MAFMHDLSCGLAALRLESFETNTAFSWGSLNLRQFHKYDSAAIGQYINWRSLECLFMLTASSFGAKRGFGRRKSHTAIGDTARLDQR